MLASFFRLSSPYLVHLFCTDAIFNSAFVPVANVVATALAAPLTPASTPTPDSVSAGDSLSAASKSPEQRQQVVVSRPGVLD